MYTDGDMKLISQCHGVVTGAVPAYVYSDNPFLPKSDRRYLLTPWQAKQIIDTYLRTHPNNLMSKAKKAA